MRVDRNFSDYERAKILRAVNEWNHALAGYIRIELAPEPYDTAAYLASSKPHLDGWIVAKTDSSNNLWRTRAMGRTLALTYSTGSGALVMVAADRVGTRDLGAIMMHEFGHALGASHEKGSALMSPVYAGNRQQCIDKVALHAVASVQRLPFEALNACDVSHAPPIRSARSPGFKG